MSRRALVTGGTRGIGAAIVEALAGSGYEVVATGTAPKGSAPTGCRYVACDFSDAAQLRAFAQRLPAMELSVLVNNAGINRIGPVADYPPEEFLRIQQVNTTAPFLLCQAAVPGMRSRRFGRIVNVTSIFSVVSRAGRAAYSTSKFGLVGLTKALALEVAGDNVLVNCVAPGFVETDMTRGILGPQGMAEVATTIPLRRLASPAEIAHAVRFLVSDENTYMTGQQLVVDGGFTCS